MKKITLLYNLVLMNIIILAIYYVYGGYRFPDYLAYQDIAYGYVGKEGRYLAEYVSRFILYNGILDGFNRVDQLALFSQILCIFIIILIITKNVKNIYIALVFTAFFAPLLLTTTLRAAPLYVFFFYISIYKINESINISTIITLTLFGLLFHDSVIILTCVLFFTYLLNNLKYQFSNRLLNIIIVISFLFVFLFPYISDIVKFISSDILGARAVYLGEVGFSVFKLIFIIILNVISYRYINNTDSPYFKKLTLAVFLVFTNLIFSFGSTAGIRFSVFAYIYFFTVNRGFLFGFESVSLKNQVISSFFLYPLLFLRLYLLL